MLFKENEKEEGGESGDLDSAALVFEVHRG